jgi:hypothetical protein
VQLALSADCNMGGVTAIYAGDTVVIARGMCAWDTAAAAQTEMAGQTATITVDGAPLQPVRYSIGYPHESRPLFCAAAQADWKATAGRHVAAGVFSLPGSPVHTCTMDVLP